MNDMKVTVESWGKIYKEATLEDYKELKNIFESKDLNMKVGYLERFKKYKPEDRYLEIGCGLATVGLRMAAIGYKVFGLDISMEGLKKANKLYKDRGIKGYFVCGDILNPPFKDNSFDLIYGGGVIEHFKNTQQAIDESYRITKKRGLVLTSFPTFH